MAGTGEAPDSSAHVVTPLIARYELPNSLQPNTSTGPRRSLRIGGCSETKSPHSSIGGNFPSGTRWRLSKLHALPEGPGQSGPCCWLERSHKDCWSTPECAYNMLKKLQIGDTMQGTRGDLLAPGHRTRDLVCCRDRQENTAATGENMCADRYTGLSIYLTVLFTIYYDYYGHTRGSG